MDNFTPQQKRKLIKLIEVGDKGLPAILEYLYEIEENTENSFLSVEDRFNNIKEYVYELSQEDKQSILDAVRRSISDSKIARDVLSLITIDYDDVAQRASKLIEVPKPQPAEKVDYNRIKASVLNDIVILTPENGKDADEDVVTNKVVNSLENKLPAFGEAFRDGLELLQGDNRLDKSAIKGIDDYDELVQYAKSGKGSTQFTAITGIKEIVAGTNILIDKTNPQFPIISSQGGSVPEDGSVSRTGDYITTITKGSTVWTLTRTSNYISSFTNGTNTWTVTRDGNNRISSWSVV